MAFSRSLLLGKRVSLVLPSIKPASSSSTSTSTTSLHYYSTRLTQQLQLSSKPNQLLQPNQTRSFTQTNKTSAIMSQAFLDAIKTRRSVYPLKKESPIDDKKIQDIVSQALLHTPSSFNSQSTRVVVLLKGEHEKFWEITKAAIKAVVPADAYPASEQKLDMFKGAYGTVLFFDDRTVVSKFQETYAAYADKFPAWATQSNAMTQFAVWTALELEGLGANLQHYNPLVDQQVTDTWELPKTWELNAQLVFGAPVSDAGDKTFMDIKERFKVFGA